MGTAQYHLRGATSDTTMNEPVLPCWLHAHSGAPVCVGTTWMGRDCGPHVHAGPSNVLSDGMLSDWYYVPYTGAVLGSARLCGQPSCSTYCSATLEHPCV